MIEGLGQPKPVRVDAPRTDAVARTAPAPKVDTKATRASDGPAARLAAEGAPVDTAKVDRLRAAIADGSYRIDPDTIADKMIADWRG